jgi:hypothetical protein
MIGPIRLTDRDTLSLWAPVEINRHPERANVFEVEWLWRWHGPFAPKWGHVRFAQFGPFDFRRRTNRCRCGQPISDCQRDTQALIRERDDMAQRLKQANVKAKAAEEAEALLREFYARDRIAWPSINWHKRVGAYLEAQDTIVDNTQSGSKQQ